MRVVDRLKKAHFDLHISPEEFDQVTAELTRTLDYCLCRPRERV